MIPVIIFVAGVAVGVGACKLYDVLRHYSDPAGAEKTEPQRTIQSSSVAQPIEHHYDTTTKLDISSLESIMKQYGVDISAPNCLYMLCNKIKSNSYKRLLDNIIENTSSGKDLISFIKKINIDVFIFPKAVSSQGCFFIPISTIDQLLTASAIATNCIEPRKKVELLINAAYASAIERFKKNFGNEFGKLIKAEEDGCDVQSYYNDIIKEIKVSRDFLSA